MRLFTAIKNYTTVSFHLINNIYKYIFIRMSLYLTPTPLRTNSVFLLFVCLLFKSFDHNFHSRCSSSICIQFTIHFVSSSSSSHPPKTAESDLPFCRLSPFTAVEFFLPFRRLSSILKFLRQFFAASSPTKYVRQIGNVFLTVSYPISILTR